MLAAWKYIKGERFSQKRTFKAGAANKGKIASGAAAVRKGIFTAKDQI